MAVSSKFTQKSLFGGGSTKSNTPKIDTSYGANLGGGQQNNIVNLPTLSSGVNSGGLAAAPQNLTYQNNLKNMTGIIGQGGAGGVTNEGVVLGNPNVERMPTINRNSSSAHQFKTFGQLVDETGKDLTSYAANGIGGDTSVQESVLRRGTPEWDAVMSPLNIEGQNSGAVTGDGAMTTYAANGIGAEDTGATGGATGSKGSTGGSTAGSGAVDTYEEFLLKQEGFYKEQLDKLNAQIEQNKQKTIQLAEQQRQQVEQQAETERQRGVIDARSSYAQNLATYGANAEQLAAMGLSGSGYSDYLNQQAYATQRAETQNANAQAAATKLNAKYTADATTLAAEQQANSDRLNAELSYAENMQGNAEKLAQYQQQKSEEAKAEEEQKKQYYAMLLGSANTGEYTSEQVASLGAQYGLDETQISQLQAAADKYKSDQQMLSYTEALNYIAEKGIYSDPNYLDELLSMGEISQEQYNKLIAQYTQIVSENEDSSLTDTDKIDEMHESGKLDDETYNKQKEQWNEQLDTSDSAFNMGYMPASDAKKLLESTLNNEWASDERKKEMQETYDRLYKVVTNDVQFNNDGGWWIFGSTNMDNVGNNFSVKDGSGFIYRIESGGQETDPMIVSLAKDVAEGAVFGLRGNVYYKKNGKVYKIQQRANSYGDHYSKLVSKFFD